MVLDLVQHVARQRLHSEAFSITADAFILPFITVNTIKKVGIFARGGCKVIGNLGWILFGVVALDRFFFLVPRRLRARLRFGLGAGLPSRPVLAAPTATPVAASART